MSRVNGVDVEGRDGAAWELLHQRAIEVGLLDEGATQDLANDAIEVLLDREVATPEPTLEECRRWYDAHPQAFAAGELVHARHILFGVVPGTPVEPLRRKAEAVLHELQDHPDRFERYAAELSNCPSGAQGGVLGQLARGDCVEEFEREVFQAGQQGVLRRLVQTRYGFHIVAVDGYVPGHRLPFEVVREKVADAMTRSVWQRAFVQYIGVLAGEARLEDVDLGAAASPLVQ